MNDIIRGRATRVRAGIVAAGAAAAIAGGGLLLGGFGSGHQAAPVGVVKGQRVDFDTPDQAQCDDIVRQLNEGRDFAAFSVEVKTAERCDQSQQDDDPDSLSDVCRAETTKSNGDTQDLDLVIECASEAQKVAKASASLNPSSPNLVNTQPSASPDDTDPSDGPDPSDGTDGTDPSAPSDS